MNGRFLLRPETVRSRAHLILDRARADALEHWRFEPRAMPALAAYVAETIRLNYPALDVPFHARWRHFLVDGVDHAADLRLRGDVRALFDLAIVSVLLDAGAGPDWRYRLRDGRATARSEGLAMASLDMFQAGVFSADPRDPLRADGERLAALGVDDLRAGFQVADDNPLVGLEPRVALLNALGRAGPRPSMIYDRLSGDGIVRAPDILAAVLDAFGAIWPQHVVVEGVAMGDCWRHRALEALPDAPGWMPFHKLSQWLSYSLIEPLQWVGHVVKDIGELTGLPEYRNGGLFIDGGALVPRDPAALTRDWRVEDEFIVEWRALTVALLDEIAEPVRTIVGKSAEDWPLATILEGGTWAAGRRLAREKREGGAPPLNVVAGGTVF